MNIEQASQLAKEVRDLYETLELQRHGRSWTTEEIALGFVGDVGDLAKLVLAHEGVRSIEDVQEKLGHELSDCLWSILVLADRCGIDLEREFSKTMTELKASVSSKLST